MEPRRRARKPSQLRQERDVCSMATITSISERVEHATGICRRRAASEAIKKIGFYKDSTPTEPRRRARKASQLRQERDVCSIATNRSTSERVKHATGIVRRQAASGFWDERLRSGKPDRTAIGQARTNAHRSYVGCEERRVFGVEPLLTCGLLTRDIRVF